MGQTFKYIVGFIFLLLLAAHLLMLAFFLAPTEKLLTLVLGSQANVIETEAVPAPVQSFLTEHKISVEPDFEETGSLVSKIALGVLQVRRSKLMDEQERLVLDLNLLPFGEGIVGLEEAADYYYNKPTSQLSDSQWVTLVNLHKMFLKK